MHHESSKDCAWVDFNVSICRTRLANQENVGKPKTKQTTKELHPLQQFEAGPFSSLEKDPRDEGSEQQSCQQSSL
jgi:hypothetical protein